VLLAWASAYHQYEGSAPYRTDDDEGNTVGCYGTVLGRKVHVYFVPLLREYPTPYSLSLHTNYASA
jgi:hypothetical protein